MTAIARGIVLETVDGRRRPAALGVRLGAPGSQGAVWQVRERPSLAVKLVRRPESDGFAEKVEAMLRSRPERLVARNGIVRVAWALGRVRDPGTERLIGFLQPALNAKRFGGLALALRGDRPLAPRGSTWRWYLELAADLARTLAEIHRAGHVVADLSPENLLATTGAAVAFVDVDGWQIHDSSTGKTLPSPFSRDNYTPPEHLDDSASRALRNTSADHWALAVLLAEILQLGAHPFAGVPVQGEPPFDVRANVEARRSAALGAPLRTPPLAPRPELVLTGPLRGLLERCLGVGYDDPAKRPGPEEWMCELADTQRDVRLCPARPLHVYPRGAPDCPWCELTLRTGHDPFGETARGTGALS